MRAHSSQRRPTQAHEEENGPNDARRIVWAGIGKFFLMDFFLMYNLSTKAHEGPQQPTKADAGPQRWKTAHRSVFFKYCIFKNLQLIHKSPRRPTATNEAQHRPTKTERKPTKAYSSQRRLTQARTEYYYRFNYCRCI